MENHNGRKRTLNSELLHNNLNPSQKIKLDYELYYIRPMTLNTWTQTTSDDFDLCSILSNQNDDNKIHNRVKKLEETIKLQSEMLKKLLNDRNEFSTSLSTVTSDKNVNYTIIAERSASQVDMIEPIEIHISDQYADDINSEDSGRLQICSESEPEEIKPLNKLKPASSTPLYKRNDSNISSNETVPDLGNVMVSIGPNNTRIPAKIYETMNWESASIATRKLLMAVFDRQTLATHTMTGKPSPAFKEQEKPTKAMLDPKITSDIIFAVTRKTGATARDVRNSITTKCADENKIYKLKNKKNALQEINKENIMK